GIIMGSQVQTHPMSQEHRSGFAIEARSFGRLFNRQISATASVRRMGNSNYNRLLRNQEKHKAPQILFNRKRRFGRQLGRNGIVMGMRNTVAALSNVIDSSCHIQGRVGVSKRDNNSTNMERACVVDSPNANYSTLEGARRQLKHPKGGSMNEEEQTETTSREDLNFLGRRREKREQLFKECLLNTGLTGQSTQGIIDGWPGS
ncbi:MAG: hypothetical protein EZS28_040615, partial [Streblomastix strix]